MAEIIYGSELAKEFKTELKRKTEALILGNKRIPQLVVILVGENPASISYIKGKSKACEDVGFLFELKQFPETIQTDELIETIENYNRDDKTDAILVQMPIPAHLDEKRVVDSILPEKDVDGFHTTNVGKLYNGEDGFVPCTPLGIMEILRSIPEAIEGKEAVVLGRSRLVGTPVAQLLLRENATVTICHSKTKDVSQYCKQADILVVAIGRRHFVKGDWIKEGAVVIDVGVNRHEDGKLYGDVEFENAKEKAAYITPVPRGVGPMTIAMLLQNTWKAYCDKEGK